MSFLQDYTTFTSGNEAPPIFHTWSALSVLSSAVSRRVWVEQGFFTVYANMYILLVGTAGIKKSTAMDVGCGLIQAVKDIPIAPASITREALTQWMAEKESPCKKTYAVLKENGNTGIEEYTHVSMFSNEFITLINAASGTSGMIEMLTDIFDRKVFEVKTKNKGTDFIEKPYITLLGCLTTSTLSNLFSTKIISSGFSRRCVFVHSNDYGTPVPRPSLSPAQYAAWDRCVARIKALQAISGEFTWDSEATAWFDSWYVKNHQLKVTADSDILRGFLQTKPSYVLKIAMLTTLSESDNLVLTKEHLQLAVAMLNDVESGMLELFQGTGRNELSSLTVAIEQMINVSQDNVIPTKRIYATFYKDANTKEIDDMLAHLHKVGKLELGTIVLNGTIVNVVRKITADQP